MRAKKSLLKPKKTVIFSNDFYSDMRADGMLYALIVRSPFSSGKINSIQLENQEPLPENYEIFTASDIPNQKFITTFGTHTEIFCTGEIKYKGEPVALIAGPDKKTLFELREKIKIILDSRKNEISEENSKETSEKKSAETSENGQTAKTEQTAKIKAAENSKQENQNQGKAESQDSPSFSEKSSESEIPEKSDKAEGKTFSSSESETSGESSESEKSSSKLENPENSESLKSENLSEEKKSGESFNQDFGFDKTLEIATKEVAAEREVLSGDAESEFKNPENKIIEGIWRNSGSFFV